MIQTILRYSLNCIIVQILLILKVTILAKKGGGGSNDQVERRDGHHRDENDDDIGDHRSYLPIGEGDAVHPFRGFFPERVVPIPHGNGVFPHRFGGIGVDGREDVDGIGLNGEAVIILTVAVLHGDEEGDHGGAVLGGKAEGAVL